MIQQATERPDFTGKWQFNRERSKLQIPEPDSASFEIEHRDPVFRLTRTLVYAGAPNTIGFEVTTDGKEHLLTFGDLTARVSVQWEGASLVLDSTVRSKDDEGTNIVRYALSDDGQTFIATERLESAKHRHENLWVFDRLL